MGGSVDSVTISSGIYPRGFTRKNDWPWPLVKSSELVTLKYGKAMRATDRAQGKVPVYGTNGQCGWHNEALHEGPGDIWPQRTRTFGGRMVR